MLTDQFENQLQLQHQCMIINAKLVETVFRKLQFVLFSNIIEISSSSFFALDPNYALMQLRCVLSMHFFQTSESNLEIWSHLNFSGGEEVFAALLPVWKCIESTNPCCPPVQLLRFMHFRNLHHCLFKCRKYWLHCLNFRTFLSCCAVKIFQPKNPEIPAFQKPSSPLFSSTQNSTEISITYLPERFVNLHHKSPCCFSPNV